MKRICFSLLFAGWLCTAATDTFTGVITDTMCGARHGMMKNQPDEQCIKMCVKGQYVYALFDGTKVVKLSDQKNSAKYAARKVKVTGDYNSRTSTIKVSSIKPAEGE